MSPAFWLGLQADYNLAMAEWKRGEKIADQVRPLSAAG